MTTPTALAGVTESGEPRVTAPLPDLVTRQEAAEILDVDLTTVDRYARRGADDPLRLERLKSGTGAVRFRRRDVERLRDRRETVL